VHIHSSYLLFGHPICFETLCIFRSNLKVDKFCRRYAHAPYNFRDPKFLVGVVGSANKFIRLEFVEVQMVVILSFFLGYIMLYFRFNKQSITKPFFFHFHYHFHLKSIFSFHFHFKLIFFFLHFFFFFGSVIIPLVEPFSFMILS
jgi:hypothetical protein